MRELERIYEVATSITKRKALGVSVRCKYKQLPPFQGSTFDCLFHRALPDVDDDSLSDYLSKIIH